MNILKEYRYNNKNLFDALIDFNTQKSNYKKPLHTSLNVFNTDSVKNINGRHIGFFRYYDYFALTGDQHFVAETEKELAKRLYSNFFAEFQELVEADKKAGNKKNEKEYVGMFKIYLATGDKYPPDNCKRYIDAGLIDAINFQKTFTYSKEVKLAFKSQFFELVHSSCESPPSLPLAPDYTAFKAIEALLSNPRCFNGLKVQYINIMNNTSVKKFGEKTIYAKEWLDGYMPAEHKGKYEIVPLSTFEMWLNELLKP